MLNNSTLRYGKLFSYPRQIVKYALSAFYPIFIKLYKMPRVLSVDETLDELINNDKSSMVRFGDSEILYLTDRLNLPYQKYEEHLATALKEILKNNNKNLLVGLPIGYEKLENLNKEGKIFWKSQVVWNYSRFKKILNLNSTYFNASITRLYYGIEGNLTEIRFQKWKQIFNANSALLIEGEKTRFGIGNDLLSGINNVKRIIGPKHEGYSKADEIINYVITLPKPDIVLVALGPAAKYITFKLHNMGYRVIDIGNLDIEYEWYLRKVDQRIIIPGKYTSEVKGGRDVNDFPDEKFRVIYNQQIINDFS